MESLNEQQPKALSTCVITTPHVILDTFNLMTPDMTKSLADLVKCVKWDVYTFFRTMFATIDQLCDEKGLITESNALVVWDGKKRKLRPKPTLTKDQEKQLDDEMEKQIDDDVEDPINDVIINTTSEESSEENSSEEDVAYDVDTNVQTNIQENLRGYKSDDPIINMLNLSKSPDPLRVVRLNDKSPIVAGDFNDYYEDT